MNPSQNDPSFPPQTKACPYCGEPILSVAVKCKHCGSDVSPVRPKSAPKWIVPAVVALLLIGLAVTNPTKSDFSEFVSEQMESRSEQAPRGQASPLDALVSGIASAAVSKMTERSNLVLFSIFDVDASLVRAFGQDAANRKFLGVAGMIFPLSGASSQPDPSLASSDNTPLDSATKEFEPDAEQAAFESKACSEPVGSKSQGTSHVTKFGTLRIVDAETDYGNATVACLDSTPVSFEGVQYVSIEKAFSLYAFELFGWRFGERTVYLLDTATGGTQDGSITNSCAFVTVFGKGKFEILPNVECPVYESGNGIEDLQSFEVERDTIRFKDRNPAGFSDKDDIGEFEFTNGEIKTLKPFKTDDYYRLKFASLNSEDILKEAWKDGRWEPGNEEIHLSCGACEPYAEKYCFKYASISPQPDNLATQILDASCEAYK